QKRFSLDVGSTSPRQGVQSHDQNQVGPDARPGRNPRRAVRHTGCPTRRWLRPANSWTVPDALQHTGGPLSTGRALRTARGIRLSGPRGEGARLQAGRQRTVCPLQLSRPGNGGGFLALVELRVPDLDLAGAEIRVSAWHAKTGQRMAAGDRLVEITAGDVT